MSDTTATEKVTPWAWIWVIVSSRCACWMKRAEEASLAARADQTCFVMLVTLGALLGSRRRLAGVSGGVLAANILGYLLIVQPSLKMSGLRWASLMRAHAHPLATTAVWTVLCWSLANILRSHNVPDVLVLLVMGVVLMVSFLALCVSWPSVFLGQHDRWAVELARTR